MSRRQTRNNQNEPEFMTRHEWQSERQQLMRDFETKMKSQNKSLHHKMDRLLEIHASNVNVNTTSNNREADSVDAALSSGVHHQEILHVIILHILHFFGQSSQVFYNFNEQLILFSSLFVMEIVNNENLGKTFS